MDSVFFGAMQVSLKLSSLVCCYVLLQVREKNLDCWDCQLDFEPSYIRISAMLLHLQVFRGKEQQNNTAGKNCL